jgi:hypothetical protein
MGKPPRRPKRQQPVEECTRAPDALTEFFGQRRHRGAVPARDLSQAAKLWPPLTLPTPVICGHASAPSYPSRFVALPYEARSCATPLRFWSILSTLPGWSSSSNRDR